MLIGTVGTLKQADGRTAFEATLRNKLRNTISNLVGALEHFGFSIYRECHHPNWLMFLRGLETSNQQICCVSHSKTYPWKIHENMVRYWIYLCIWGALVGSFWWYLCIFSRCFLFFICYRKGMNRESLILEGPPFFSKLHGIDQYAIPVFTRDTRFWHAAICN